MLDVYAALNYGRTTENADSAQAEQSAADSTRTEQNAADSAQAEQSAEQTAGTAQSESTASASKTITAGGGESVNLGW